MKNNIINHFKEHKALNIIGILASFLPIIILFPTWMLTYEKMYYTATYMPILIGVGAWIPFIICCINFIFFHKKWLTILVIVLGLLFSFCIFAMIALALSKFFYFFIAGTPYFVAIILILCCIIVWTKFIKLKKKAYIITSSVLTLVIIVSLLFGIFNLLPVYFNSGAVVFAIEDEYQICWSTSTTTTGYVEINGIKYTDSTAGIMNVSTLHKTIVPRNVLDETKSYSIHSNGITLSRAYLTAKTSSISKEYSFRPVDASDGLQIYNFSDNHFYKSGAIQASRYFGNKLDFIIANGDHINDVSTEWEITFVYDILAKMTSSSIPVIITRGNHETVGSILDKLPNYYASKTNNFYYSVNFGDVKFLVLDIGSDMEDTNKTISTTADFTQYRKVEQQWLKTIANDPNYLEDGINHVVSLCHIAFPISEKCNNDICNNMIQNLESLNTSILISGHSHKVEYFEPDTSTNRANFPVVLGSVRSDYYNNEGLGGAQFTGTAIEITGNTMTLKFTNSKLEVREEHVITLK
ncbi:MAG: metallophosphoesterase [Clostridia bacterium]|nr:metallophosphoesterase [Clostridia bacterium]